MSSFNRKSVPAFIPVTRFRWHDGTGCNGSCANISCTHPLTGAVITKLDGDCSRGRLVAFRALVGQPILWIGTGERAVDLEKFHPERFVKRLLGEGDLQGLMEKAEATCGAAEAEENARVRDRFNHARFS